MGSEHDYSRLGVRVHLTTTHDASHTQCHSNTSKCQCKETGGVTQEKWENSLADSLRAPVACLSTCQYRE